MALLPSKREVRHGWLYPLNQDHRAYLPNLTQCVYRVDFLPKAMPDRAGGQEACSFLRQWKWPIELYNLWGQEGKG